MENSEARTALKQAVKQFLLQELSKIVDEVVVEETVLHDARQILEKRKQSKVTASGLDPITEVELILHILKERRGEGEKPKRGRPLKINV